MEKVCPRCGTRFECRHDNISQCHCVDVHLNAHQLHYLKLSYPTCLCHDCLCVFQQSFYAFVINPRYRKRI